VRYIVPVPAAASPDIIARLLTERLGRLWNQQVVVDNRSERAARWRGIRCQVAG
jgi:tripartite-type tricarboxylate transporter receptor subunit TctC